LDDYESHSSDEYKSDSSDDHTPLPKTVVDSQVRGLKIKFMGEPLSSATTFLLNCKLVCDVIYFAAIDTMLALLLTAGCCW